MPDHSQISLLDIGGPPLDANQATTARLGPNSLVPPRTMGALLAFSAGAAGANPLSQISESAWRKFLITACQEEVAFDTDELTAWFVAHGWSLGDARGLTERFINEATLLTDYAEALRS
jgi:hypothetical protein